MTIKNFKELIVWQKSMDLAETVYKTVRSFPKEEIYGLSDQMRRAVVSIPSNIAEGNQRKTTKEYIHFLFVSKGSLGELETQIMLSGRLNYITNEQMNALLSDCQNVGKLLNGLVNSLQNSNFRGES